MADKPFKGKMNVRGTEITVLSVGNEDDFISLTDIALYFIAIVWKSYHAVGNFGG
ncbi:MAG: hypothetical protein LBN38_06815 [Verrucomicrobiota bacterium]|jgi:hypothetical protein|nr:hypothetical protein [Verrucomicrobiota bacterium]